MYGDRSWDRSQPRRHSAPSVGEGQPYQVRKQIQNIGKTVESSKKKIYWRFTFGEEGGEHEVVLEHSTLSGKKKLFLNGDIIFESQKVGNFDWSHGWPMGSHVCRCDILGEGNYELTIDAKPFGRWPRADPNLIEQLAAAKRDSEQTLRQDEQRRLDMIQEQRRYDLANEKKKDRNRSTRSKSDVSSSSKKNDTQKSSKPNQQTQDILCTDILDAQPSQHDFDPIVSQNSDPRNGQPNDTTELLRVGMQFQNMGMNQSSTDVHFRSLHSEPSDQLFSNPPNFNNNTLQINNQSLNDTQHTISWNTVPNLANAVDNQSKPAFQTDFQPLPQVIHPQVISGGYSNSTGFGQSVSSGRPGLLQHAQSQMVPSNTNMYPGQSFGPGRGLGAMGISMMGVNNGSNQSNMMSRPRLSIDAAFQTQAEVYQQREQYMKQQQQQQSQQMFMASQDHNIMANQYPTNNVGSVGNMNMQPNMVYGSHQWPIYNGNVNFPNNQAPTQPFGPNM